MRAAALASVRAVRAGRPASTGVWRCDEEDLLAVRAHDDARGCRGTPWGRAAPWAGSHSRGRGRTSRQGSRSRHALMPGEWSWPLPGCWWWSSRATLALDQEVQQYERDGAAVPRGVLEAKEVARALPGQ